MINITLITIILLSIKAKHFPSKNNVIILDDNNLDDALDKYKHILILFYAPWCGYCKKMFSDFEKAAAILKKEDKIYLAKMDATTELKSAERFSVQAFPTLIFFKKGVPKEYTGGRKKREIITWLRKKTGAAARKKKTKKDLDKFINSAEVSLVYFGKDKKKLSDYKKVAKEVEDLPFVIVNSEKIAQEFNVQRDTVVLFKTFDEKRNILTNITKENIKDFINKYSSPKVMKYGDDAAQIVFVNNVPGLLLFCEDKTDKINYYEKILEEIANKGYNIKPIIITDFKEEMSSKLAEYIGVKETELPTIRIADTRNEIKQKK